MGGALTSEPRWFLAKKLELTAPDLSRGCVLRPALYVGVTSAPQGNYFGVTSAPQGNVMLIVLPACTRMHDKPEKAMMSGAFKRHPSTLL